MSSPLIIVSRPTPGVTVVSRDGSVNLASVVPTAMSMPFFVPPTSSANFAMADPADPATGVWAVLIAANGYRESGGSIGDYVEYTDVLFSPGAYTKIDVNLLKGPDQGVVTITIDGNVVGVYDCYAATLAPAIAEFDSFTLTGLTHTVRFEVTGQNGAATDRIARLLAFALSPGNAGG